MLQVLDFAVVNKSMVEFSAKMGNVFCYTLPHLQWVFTMQLVFIQGCAWKAFFKNKQCCRQIYLTIGM
jgi:hypothetical protein